MWAAVAMLSLAGCKAGIADDIGDSMPPGTVAYRDAVNNIGYVIPHTMPDGQRCAVMVGNGGNAISCYSHVDPLKPNP